MVSDNYYLYFDESGDFDAESKQNAWLVGGLMSSYPFREDEAIAIFTKAYQIHAVEQDPPPVRAFHANEFKQVQHNFSIYPSFVKTVMDLLASQEIQPIVFDNKDKISIVDPHTTYLNILTEGIVQLFNQLYHRKQQVNLHIIVSRRMKEDRKTPGVQVTIGEDEYRTRLQEAVSLHLLHRGQMSLQKSLTIKLEIGSARQDVRLMLTDLVCNAWYSGKRDPGIRETMISALRSYYFRVVEHGSSAALDRLLAEGALGEALYQAVTNLLPSKLTMEKGANKEKSAAVIGVILDRLLLLPADDRNYHLETIMGRISYFLNVARNYSHTLALIGQVQNQIIQPLQNRLAEKEADQEQHFLKQFTAKLLQGGLDAANHQGDVLEGNRICVVMDKLMPELNRHFENVNLNLEYLLRKAVFLHNCYDFEGSIALADKLESFFSDLASLLPAAMPVEIFPGGNQPLYAAVLGKILGSRLQAYIFLGRTNSTAYAKARADSEQAIGQFVEQSDILRHYLYRCHIETDDGNLNVALQYLARGVDLPGSAAPESIAARFAGDTEGWHIFGLAHYTRLMAKAALTGGFEELLQQLKGGWDRYQLNDYPRLREGFQGHPAEIIYWKRGTFHLLQNEVAAGLKQHKLCTELCFKNKDNFTLQTVGIGVLIEQASLLARNDAHERACRDAVRTARNKFKKLKEEYQNKLETLPSTVDEYFNLWGDFLTDISDVLEKDRHTAIKLLAGMAHRIPF